MYDYYSYLCKIYTKQRERERENTHVQNETKLLFKYSKNKLFDIAFYDHCSRTLRGQKDFVRPEKYTKNIHANPMNRVIDCFTLIRVEANVSLSLSDELIESARLDNQVVLSSRDRTVCEEAD